MLRWSGQNANQKVGPDKMPTTDKSHGQNANLGWHFVRLAFRPVGILSTHLLDQLYRKNLGCFKSIIRDSLTVPYSRKTNILEYMLRFWEHKVCPSVKDTILFVEPHKEAHFVDRACLLIFQPLNVCALRKSQDG